MCSLRILATSPSHWFYRSPALDLSTRQTPAEILSFPNILCAFLSSRMSALSSSAVRSVKHGHGFRDWICCWTSDRVLTIALEQGKWSWTCLTAFFCTGKRIFLFILFPWSTNKSNSFECQYGLTCCHIFVNVRTARIFIARCSSIVITSQW